jgi:RNA polymerase sigma-70 factor (ECF subfamily)
MQDVNLTYNDKELFARIAQGEETAFTGIYLRYTQKLMPHVARLLDSESWAEEIVQDVFTKLWEIRGTLGSVENPSAYLFRMASNRTLDHLKRRSVEVKMQYWVARNTEAALSNTTEKQFDFRVSENLLKEAVSELTAQKQKIFRLRHEDGYSYEEIASELEISKNTVRNHMADALHFIRRYLLQRGVFHALWAAYYLGRH